MSHSSEDASPFTVGLLCSGTGRSGVDVASDAAALRCVSAQERGCIYILHSLVSSAFTLFSFWIVLSSTLATCDASDGGAGLHAGDGDKESSGAQRGVGGIGRKKVFEKIDKGGVEVAACVGSGVAVACWTSKISFTTSCSSSTGSP